MNYISDVSMTKEIQTLIAALETDYLKNESLWKTFAEKNLIAASTVPTWLIDLYEAEDKQIALSALWKGLGTLKSAEHLDETSLELGFLYIRFFNNELNVLELLLLAGQISDNRNYDYPECSAFFALANDYEQLDNNSTSELVQLRDRVVALFSQHFKLAQASLDSLKKKYS